MSDPPNSASQNNLEPKKSGASKDTEEAHAAFLRWQDIRIAHVGNVINLVLTLTTASLAFGVKLLLDKGNNLPVVLGCSLLVLVLAIAAGLMANYSRLFDVRYTAKAARARELWRRQDAGEKLSDKQKLKAESYDDYSDKADEWGSRTWCFLLLQLPIFAIGVFLLVFSVYQYSRSVQHADAPGGRYVSIQGDTILLDTATGEWCSPWYGEKQYNTTIPSCKNSK
jgi:hypothetical protein